MAVWRRRARGAAAGAGAPGADEARAAQAAPGDPAVEAVAEGAAPVRRPRVLRELDIALLRAIRGAPLPPTGQRAVLLYTRAGEHGLLWQAVCLAGAATSRRHRRAYLAAARTVLTAYLLNIALKYVVRRRRPTLEELPALSTTVTALSYPSAHSTTSFAAARLLSRDCGLPRARLYAAAAAMALSRVYVGVHYPSDIAAGAILGTAIANRADAASP